jgi:ribonucleotide monophosphatase NagD (HAD superfamily)
MDDHHDLNLDSYAGYLIDLDGTLYVGDELIPGAKEFVHRLRSANKPHAFVTKEQVAMIGDDLESDVRGALAIGLNGILVLSGKTTETPNDDDSAPPTHLLPSVEAFL